MVKDSAGTPKVLTKWLNPSGRAGEVMIIIFNGVSLVTVKPCGMPRGSRAIAPGAISHC